MRPLLLFLMGVVVSPVNAQPPIADIDALAKKHRITEDTPGVGILVVQNGKPLVERQYGLARIRDRLRLTAQTTFELASVSKTFTAVAILKLHDRGLLSVDDDVRKHLLELPEYRKEKPITIRHLLQHTSGLPEYLNFKDIKSKDPKFTRNEDYLPQFALVKDKHPLRFDPGQKFQYCNSNYLLLSSIIERVTKKSFGTVLEEEIFKPLEMKQSWVYEKPRSAPKHPKLGLVNAISYVKDPKGGFKEDWASPPFKSETLLTTGDGAIWTNLEDMQRWDAAVRAGKLLKAETWQAALKPSKTRDGKTNNYGYGWSLYFSGDKLTAFGHDGAWGGFRTSYYRDVTKDRTIILLSNRADFDVDKFWKALIDILDGK